MAAAYPAGAGQRQANRRRTSRSSATRRRARMLAPPTCQWGRRERLRSNGSLSRAPFSSAASHRMHGIMSRRYGNRRTSGEERGSLAPSPRRMPRSAAAHICTRRADTHQSNAFCPGSLSLAPFLFSHSLAASRAASTRTSMTDFSMLGNICETADCLRSIFK